MGDGMVITVDIGSLAAVVSDAESPKALKAALRYAKVVMQGSAVAVVMTHKSWNAVTNNVGVDSQADIIANISQQQGSLDSKMSVLTSLVSDCHARLADCQEALLAHESMAA